MIKDNLKKILIEQNNDFLENTDYISRSAFQKIKELEKLPHIIIISGLRRAGKSTFLNQINKNLYPSKKKAYLNFEDEKLLNFNVTEFDLIYESFLELDKNNNVFFLDEIQNINQWEIAIRRLYEKKIKFFITGSNASLLSKELGTKLTGRHINITLYPFSFKEFLTFKRIEYSKEELHITRKKTQIFTLFEEFLIKGGIPEYLKYGRKEVIEQVYKDILYKDILVRYKLTDEKSLKELAKYLISNVGKEFSYNKLKKMLNLGSPNTIKSYISHLENSYLIFTVEQYNFSLKKQIYSNKKVYAIDPAFIENVSFKFSEDLGRLLENLVFIELKRRNQEVYYHRNKKECDFVIKKDLNISYAIQVCHTLDEDNRKRELEGLIDAMKSYKLKEGLLLTNDQEEKIVYKGFKIIIKPVWKWLLDI